MARQDQWLITVSVDGVNLGTFDKMDGGDVDSSETKYPPGGMLPEKTLGGKQTVGNVTVGRLYEVERDHDVARNLGSRAGKAPMTVQKQPLDLEGNPAGVPQVYTGTLKRIGYPGTDSSSQAAAMLELELSTMGGIA